jgi:hypothetical protein
MKKAYLLLFFLAVSISKGFSTAYFTAPGGTADYSVLTNWWTNATGTGTHPANFTTAADTWTFQGTCTSVSPTFTIAGTVIIIAGATVNAPATTWTIGGGAGGATAWNNAGTFNAGSGTVVFNTPTGAHALTGTMTGASKFNNLTFTGTVATSAWTFATAASINGNYSQTLGVVNAPAAILTISGNFTLSATTFTGNAAGTVNIGGSYNQSGGTYTANGNTMNITGNFAKTAGTFTAGASNISITGNWSNTGTFTANTSTVSVAGNWTNSGTFTAGTSTVRMTGTGSRTISGTISGASGRFNNLNFTGVGGSWTNSSTLAVTGNLSISSGATLSPGGTINIGGNYTNSGNFTHNFLTVNTNGSGSATFSGNMTGSNAFYYLNANGTSSVTFSSNVDVNADYNNNSATIITNGVMNVGGYFYNYSTFTSNSTLNITWDLNNYGTQIANGTTNTGGYFYNYSDFTSNGALNITWDLNNNATQNANGATTMGGYFYNYGTFTAPPSTMMVGGGWENWSTFNSNNGTVVMNAGIGNYYFMDYYMTFPNHFNNLTFNGGATWDLDFNAVDVYGNLTITNGTLVASPLGADLQVAGNWVCNDGFSNNGGQVIMIGSSPGLTLSGSSMTGGNSFGYLTFNGMGSWSFANAADVSNDLNITAGTVTAPSTNLQVAGNWINSATFNHNSGTVILNGSSSQSITGNTTFNNFALNNSAGVQLNDDIHVNNTLTLTTGLLDVANNNLIFGTAATPVAGFPSSANMIISSTGAGQPRKQYAANGSFLFPIGDNFSNYSPITLGFTGGTYGSGAFAGVTVAPLKHPNNANVNNYINRYWNVALSGITAPVYSVTASYPTSDIAGTEANMSGGQYKGSLPWTKFSPVNTSTHSFSIGGLTDAASDFTAMTTAGPVFTLPASEVICNGDSVAILATYTGDPNLVFSWSPSPGLSSTIGYGVIASPTVTTTYTVTLVDGNGFTAAPATTTVMVNPKPTPITGLTTICTGRTSNLSSSPATGTWSSNNTFWATVDPVTGAVTGQSAGNPVISYTLPTGCFAVVATVIDPSPAGIDGITTLCEGGTITLSNTMPGGVWTCANPALATIDPVTGVMSGIIAGAPNISYTITGTGCYASAAVNVYALPIVYSLSGGGAYCAGDTGVHIFLSNSENNVNYNLYNGPVLVAALAGTGSMVDFGPLTGAGNNTVTGVNATTGCSNAMSGIINISVNALPVAFNLTGGGGFCDDGSGTGGVPVGIDSSGGSDLYYLYNNSTLISGPVLGTGNAFSFPGLQNLPGTYTIIASGASTGCQSTMHGSTTVYANPLPPVDTMIGGGNYCNGGTGVHTGLNFSSTGVNYQLFDNYGNPASGLVPGANTSLDFGLIPVAGTYTVMATNATTGCTNAMYGSATVGINTLPNAYPFATPSAAYCSGDTGVHVQLNSSDYGVNYQLLRGGGSTVGTPQPGGSLLDFGLQTIPGIYTAIATDAATGCSIMMTGSEVVGINPLPAIDTVTGGGSYCAGGAGVPIGVRYASSGINYQLFDYAGATASGIIAGTNASLNFGMYTTVNTYTVLATDGTTGCTSKMYGNAAVVINSLPAIDTVKGGGSYCAGGGGMHIGLDYSDAGINYSLYKGSTLVATTGGSNSGLDFGAQTIPGTYSVTATNTITGCTNTMYGNAVVTENIPPTSYTVTSSSSSYCAGGSGVHIYLSNSDAGINYQLFNGTTMTGSPASGTGALLDLGLQTGPGAYKVVATDGANGCTSLMASSPVISTNPLPAVYTVTGGGSYCAGGAGVPVGLANSTTGISYQLMNGAAPIGSPVAGTGGSISFGPHTPAGNYTVLATNGATTCTNVMSSSATISINPTPAIFTVLGGGNYCSGSAGMPIHLSSSAAGISYQLYNGAAPAGLPITGTGAGLNFGLQTAAGNYTVAATDIATSCKSAMAGSTSINVNPAPRQYSVFGGGSICPGDPGLSVMLSGSSAGINYQLYNAGTPVGSLISGTGAMLDFGPQTAGGNYQIVAADAVTSCIDTMLRSAAITINPLPTLYSVTGGGIYCSGGTGTHIGLGLSTIGIDYQLYYGSTPVGSPVPGAGMAIDFGLQTAPGTYSVYATNMVSGCVNNMSGTAIVSMAPWVTPSVTISNDAPLMICAGVPVTFTAAPVNGGGAPTYEWNVNGVRTGTGNSYTYVPANGDLVMTTMTSSAACTTPPVASAMMGISVTPNQTPVAVITSNTNTVCPGTAVTYSATTTYGGTAPTMSWLVNSIAAGSGSTFSYTPADNDVVVLLLGSNYPCRSMDTVFSNDILMSVRNHDAPTISLTAQPSLNIAPGQMLTLTANAANGGGSPSFTWFLNKTELPEQNTATIMSSYFNDGDSVTCVVTTDDPCGMTQAFNSVIVHVRDLGTATISAGIAINILPNPNKGSFVIKGSLIPADNEPVSIEITDMIGQVVYRSNPIVHNGLVNEKIELAGSLANGMYLVTIRSGAENAIFHMVVEK